MSRAAYAQRRQVTVDPEVWIGALEPTTICYDCGAGIIEVPHHGMLDIHPVLGGKLRLVDQATRRFTANTPGAVGYDRHVCEMYR